jgi:hypothetical protein
MIGKLADELDAAKRKISTMETELLVRSRTPLMPEPSQQSPWTTIDLALALHHAADEEGFDCYSEHDAEHLPVQGDPCVQVAERMLDYLKTWRSHA